MTRPAVRLKVGWDGKFYVDGAKLAEDGLQPFIDAVQSQGAAVILHREGTGRPTPPEQQQAVERLKDAGLDLVHPIDAPSEWGALQGFELELAPNRFRMSAVRDKDMLFAYTPEGAKEPLTYLFKGVGEGALQNIDLLISANRVVETKPREPERAFLDETMSAPAFHLRFSYGREKFWQSWYPRDDVPQNLENLYHGCLSLGLHVVKESDQAPPPPDQPA